MIISDLHINVVDQEQKSIIGASGNIIRNALPLNSATIFGEGTAEGGQVLNSVVIGFELSTTDTSASATVLANATSL